MVYSDSGLQFGDNIMRMAGVFLGTLRNVAVCNREADCSRSPISRAVLQIPK